MKQSIYRVQWGKYDTARDIAQVRTPGLDAIAVAALGLPSTQDRPPLVTWTNILSASDPSPTPGVNTLGNLTTQRGTPTYRYDSMSMMDQVSKQVIGKRRIIYGPDDERIGILIDENVMSRWKIRDFSGKVLREYKSDDQFGIWTWMERRQTRCSSFSRTPSWSSGIDWGAKFIAAMGDGASLILPVVPAVAAPTRRRTLLALNYFDRGNEIENILAHTDYADYFRVGQLDNGKFPLVDFQKGADLVSVKSSGSVGQIGRLQDHIDELASSGAMVNGKPANSSWICASHREWSNHSRV